MYKFKIFFEPVGQIKIWLNKMSQKGYRLTSVHNCFYKFEKSDEKYFYDSQFIGNNTTKENEKYIDFIKEGGFKTFRAPINQLNFNFGKIRVRPYAKKGGKISTSFGNYNKEILIVESKEKFPETLLTDKKEILEQYKAIRNVYFYGAFVISCLLLYNIYLLIVNNYNVINIIFSILLTFIVGFLLYVAIKYNNNYKKYL